VSSVELKHVWKIYEGDIQAVKDASFTIEDGQFLAVLGPSGCGKSTTLRMIAGLEDISKGEIIFDGKVVNDLSSNERNIALAFESYALYHRLTVYENIAFPLRCKGMSGSDVDKKVRWIADILNVTDILKKRPIGLSGGHQQRVNLCRALVREPNVTLLDEPISHMDLRVRANMRARIRRLHDDLNLTTIYVTHDQDEAVSIADRIAVMKDARVQQIGTVDEIWNHPTNKFVATFVGEPQMNFLQGMIETTQDVSIATKDGNKKLRFNGEVDQKHVGADITIGIRPQEIGMVLDGESPASIRASIELTEFQGENVIVTVKLDDNNHSEIKAVVGAEYTPNDGETVWMQFEPEAIHLFDDETPILR
jgi:multiple sugar transport system ATP-binding protein